MPVHRVHESVDLADEFRAISRRGERLISVQRDGVYLDITTVEADAPEFRGDAA